MTANTFTASQVGALLQLHAGPNIVRGRIKPTAASSLSASDVLLMVQIPNHATVVDWWCRGGIASSTTFKISVGIQPGTAQSSGSIPIVVDTIKGTSLTSDTLCAAVSLTTSAVGGYGRLQSTMNTAVPFRVSISDDHPQQWCWLTATCGGSTTGSSSLEFVVTYLMGQGQGT